MIYQCGRIIPIGTVRIPDGYDSREENSMTDASPDRITEPFGGLPCAGLPRWEDFPDIPLYMDQVLILLNNCLYPGSGKTGDGRSLTPSMINNYIKSRILPASVRKKYYRHHLAALIMICVLKETVPINDIPKLLPGLSAVESIRDTYAYFLDIYGRTREDFRRFVEETVREHADTDHDPDRVILRLAVAGNLCKGLTDSALSLKSSREA